MADHTGRGDSPLLSTEVLANMNHEFRGPLATIKGYAATLLRHERGLSPEERHAFLQAIEDASDRIALLLDRFLELSQLEAGTLSLAPAIIPLVLPVREAMQTVQQRMPANQRQDAPKKDLFTLHLEHLASLSPPE